MSCGSTTCSSIGTERSVSRRAQARRLLYLTAKRWATFAIRCLERHRQRKALLGLDGRLLRDIGVTREQAVREAKKPFWR